MRPGKGLETVLSHHNISNDQTRARVSTALFALPDSTPPIAPVLAENTDKKSGPSNLRLRVIYASIGAAMLLGSVWYSAWTFALFFAAVQTKMLLEFYRMMRVKEIRPSIGIGLLMSMLIFIMLCLPPAVNQYFDLPPGGYTTYPPFGENSSFDRNRFLGDTLPQIYLGLQALALLLAVCLVLREIIHWPKSSQPFTNISVTYGGLLYVSLPMSLLTTIAFGAGHYDYRRVFALLFLVWASDIGAYAAGKTFGKHKMAPNISPGKTWEGWAGGFLLTLILGWALGYLLPDMPLTHRLVAAGVVAVFAPIGDLAESMLKRSVGVKDSGTMMPGHGGLLDRFDAFLLVLPVLALLQLLAG